MSDERRNDDYEDIFSDSTHKTDTEFSTRLKKADNKNSRGKSSDKTRKMWIVNTVTVLFSVIFIVVGSACIYAYTTISRINYDDTSSSNSEASKTTNSNASESSSYIGTKPEKLKDDDSVLNIMLFGADKEADGAQRSDSMILISVNSDTGELVMTSFLRDLWVDIPGYYQHRLNTSFALGGAPLATETIEQNFGIEIDRYAMVDFESFTNIIDTLGGIDLELTDEEIDYINWQSWKNNQVDTRHEITASAGVVHLNGRQALWYSRDRDSIGSDWDRTSRQRIVINTIFSELKSCNLAQLMSIIYQIGPMIQTNIDKGEIVYLAQNALTYLNYDVKQLSVSDPSVGNYDTPKIDGMDVITISDWDAERARIQTAIYGDSDYSASSESETTEEAYTDYVDDYYNGYAA